MTIRCKLCKRAFVSDEPAEKAREEVLRLMSEHLGNAHRPCMDKVAEAMATIYIHTGPHFLFQYVELPESENELRASYNENREKILTILDAPLLPGELPKKKMVLA